MRIGPPSPVRFGKVYILEAQSQMRGEGQIERTIRLQLEDDPDHPHRKQAEQIFGEVARPLTLEEEYHGQTKPGYIVAITENSFGPRFRVEFLKGGNGRPQDSVSQEGGAFLKQLLGACGDMLPMVKQWGEKAINYLQQQGE